MLKAEYLHLYFNICIHLHMFMMQSSLYDECLMHMQRTQPKQLGVFVYFLRLISTYQVSLARLERRVLNHMLSMKVASKVKWLHTPARKVEPSLVS